MRRTFQGVLTVPNEPSTTRKKFDELPYGRFALDAMRGLLREE